MNGSTKRQCDRTLPQVADTQLEHYMFRRHSVRALSGRLNALSVLRSKSFFYGAFVWAHKAHKALNSLKRRFPARAVALPPHAAAAAGAARLAARARRPGLGDDCADPRARSARPGSLGGLRGRTEPCFTTVAVHPSASFAWCDSAAGVFGWRGCLTAVFGRPWGGQWPRLFTPDRPATSSSRPGRRRARSHYDIWNHGDAGTIETLYYNQHLCGCIEPYPYVQHLDTDHPE
jgi:hypothetical protein